MVLGQFRHLEAKLKKKKLNLTRYRETNIKWVIGVNVKHKMI